MKTMTVTSHADGNGVLHLDLPLGQDAAGQEVIVTVQRVPRPMTQDEWRAWVQKTAGSITDPTFVRHPQGEHQERDPL